MTNQTHFKELSQFWARIGREIATGCEGRRKELSEKFLSVARDAVPAQAISVREFVNWDGMEGLFAESLLAILAGARMNPLAITIAQRVIASPYVPQWDNDSGVLTSLQELGQILETTSPPWFATKPVIKDRLWISWSAPEAKVNPSSMYLIDKQTSDMRFGLFGILATYFEAKPELLPEARGPGSKNHVSVWIRDYLEARASKRFDAKTQAKLQTAGLTATQRRIVSNWIQHRINFIASTQRQ